MRIKNMTKLKLTRMYAGCYKSVNTVPQVIIQRSANHEGLWICSYGDYVGFWDSLRECRDLIESVSTFTDHMYPVQFIK